MDALTHILFGQNSATVNIVDTPGVDFKDIERSLFSKEIDRSEYARIVGAPDNSVVSVGADSNGKYITILVENDDLYAEPQKRRLVWHDNGLVMFNDNFVLHEDLPRGVGTRIFARQVQGCSDMGIVKILTTASGSLNDPDYNGYYSWIRLGFNSELNSGLKNRLRVDGFEDVEDANDLMTREGGPEWWRNNGEQVRAEFDLDRESPMRGILTKYLSDEDVQLHD